MESPACVSPFNVALYGCGGWGLTVAHRLQETGVGRVVYCVDTDHVARASAAAALGCYSRPRGPVDTAIIATPPGGRLATVRDVLEQGIRRIRIEKPVAMSYVEACDIQRVCDEAGAEVVVGHTTLFADAVPAMREEAQADDAWEGPRPVFFYRLSDVPARHAGSPLWDLAAHDVAMLLTLYGDADYTVVRQGSERFGLYSERVSASFEYSWTYPSKVREAIIGGARYDEQAQVFDRRHYPCNPLDNELRAWASGTGVPLSLGVRVCELLEAVA